MKSVANCCPRKKIIKMKRQSVLLLTDTVTQTHFKTVAE